MRKNSKENRLNLSQLLLDYFQKKITLTDLALHLNDQKIKQELDKPLALAGTKQSTASRALEWAIIKDDWQLVKKLLDIGVDPNGGTEYPIFLAIGNLDSADTDKKIVSAKLILNLLKNKNVNLDVKLNTNNGIAHFITMFDKAETTLKMFLEIFPHTKLNQLDSTGKTPLLVAIEKNNLPLVKLLYSHNVPLTAVKYNRDTYIPLMWAVVFGSLQMVEFISQEMQKKDCSGMSKVMQEDLETGFDDWDIERIKYILQTRLINLNNRYVVPDTKNTKPCYMTLMHRACARGDINIVKLFIDNGGLINTDEDMQPFGHAIKNNRLELVQWLLDSNVLNHASIISGLSVCTLMKNREACQDIINKHLKKAGKELIGNDLLIIEETDEKLSILSTLQNIINQDNLHEIKKFFSLYKLTEISTHTYFHLAIKSKAINCVKYFLNFCDPFIELENISAIFLTILETNQPIMEIFVNHYRAIGKTKDLENYLIGCVSQIAEREDSEKYMLFLKELHIHYFQEKTPVSFHNFQSASSHSYMKEQGIPKEEPKISDNKHIIFKPEPKHESNPKSKTSEPTWFGGQRMDLNALKPVEGTKGYEAFVWLQPGIYTGCSPEEWEKFDATRCSFTAGSTNIKKLTLDYFLPMNINGHEKTLQCSYELRIKKSKARILLFPVPSDCKRFIIWVGGEYRSEGIHNLEDMKSLMSSNRHGTKMVYIDLPVITPENKPVC